MTSVDFSTYKPPGIYTDEQDSAVTGPTGVAVGIMAIVGPGIGFRTATESVVLNGTTNTLLSHLGIDGSSVVVKSVDGTVYVLTTDYVLTVGGGQDADTGTLPDNVLNLKRANSSGIGSGEAVIVSYHYTDAAYSAPTHFTNYGDLAAAYGQPFASDGSIQSPISLAARLAYLNGAKEIVAVAVPATPATDDFVSAYVTLLMEDAVEIIVPLGVGLDGQSDNEALGNDLANHCAEAADSNIYRIGIIGSEIGTDANESPDTLAGAIANERITLVWPNDILYFNGVSNQQIDVAGYYMAAAAAGELISLPVDTPLTRKPIAGFVNFPAPVLTSMTKSFKDQLSAAGVSVVERTRDNRMVVRHGVTTDTSTQLKREISLVRARDAMISLFYQTLLAYDIIGSPLLAETPDRVLGIATGVLETCKNSNVIVDYSGVSVRQTSSDPTVLQIQFQYVPAYPLNYVVISFSINTDTGDISVNPTTGQ